MLNELVNRLSTARFNSHIDRPEMDVYERRGRLAGVQSASTFANKLAASFV